MVTNGVPPAGRAATNRGPAWRSRAGADTSRETRRVPGARPARGRREGRAYTRDRPFAQPSPHEHARTRTRHRHRPGRPADLRRLPAARPPARGADAAVRRGGRNAAARRDAVHRPAPGVRAVDEADDPRAQGGDRLRARRRARALLQDPRARQAHPEAAVRAVGGARDADALRIRRVPPGARQLLRLPVRAVPRARVPAGRQERADARRVPARRGDVRRTRRAAARAVALRRVPAAPRAPRTPGAGRVRRARLHAAVRAQSATSSRSSARSTSTRASGGTPTTCARSWSTSRRASSCGASGT